MSGEGSRPARCGSGEKHRERSAHKPAMRLDTFVQGRHVLAPGDLHPPVLRTMVGQAREMDVIPSELRVELFSLAGEGDRRQRAMESRCPCIEPLR
jgi:hypothetical protein